MIYVEKIVGGYFVRASPPHIQGDYRSPEALCVHDLFEELTKRGAQEADIVKALSEADAA